MDDFDGTPAAETVTFRVDGTDYSIDLSAKNAEEWRTTMAPWIAHARRGTSTPRPKRTGPKRGAARIAAPAAADVRAWAKGEGIEVKPSGSIATKVLEQYRAAH